MNKEELIEKYKNEYLEFCDSHSARVFHSFWDDLKKLDEPRKIKVPEIVNQYIQDAREYNWDLQDLLKYIDDEYNEELSRWFYHDCNQETLALAWINGYEIEQEERYLVKIKGITEGGAYLNCEHISNKWYFNNRINGDNIKTHHTRKELEEAGFGWMFNCPVIEIKEVSE